MKKNKFIFDLDLTLYSNFDFPDYKSIKRNKLLNSLLSELNGDKYIFSNGNLEHCWEVVCKMKLRSTFPKNKIISVDDYEDSPKPNKKAFHFIINKLGLDINKHNIFYFEDNIDNLKSSKSFNWTTILINPDLNVKKQFKSVDYIFPTIERALFNFL